MIKLKRGTVIAAVTGVSCLGAALVALPAIAAGGTGNYGSWQVTGSSGRLPAVTDGMLAADVSANVSMSSASGSSAWLASWTPVGQQYGSSQDESYLSVPVLAGAGTSVTIAFDFPTPSSGWSFALGDVDAEQVRVEGTAANGQPVAVNPWYEGAFNYCEESPRPSTCGGPDTDVPTWNGSILIGNVTDTKGASGWFTPTQSLSTITLTATRLSGSPSFQVWIVADQGFPRAAFEPVTLAAEPPTGPAKQPRVRLDGTTRVPTQVVTIYRAPDVGKPATPVRKVRSRNHKFRTTPIRIGNRRTAVFCARVSNGSSDPVRVSVSKRVAQVRGDIVVCRRTGR